MSHPTPRPVLSSGQDASQPAPRSLSRRGLFAATAAGAAAAPLMLAPVAHADPDVTDGDTRIEDRPLVDAPDRDVDGVGTVRVLEGPATMVGATWEGEAPETISVRGRAQADGAWGEWYVLDSEDELVAAEAAEVDEEQGSEQAGAGVPAAEPVWLGEVDEIEIQAITTGTDVSERVTAHVLTTSPTTQEVTRSRQRMAAASTTTGDATGPGGPAVITRAQWGANESWTRRVGAANDLRAVVLHHTAGNNGYSRASAPQLVRGILSYHTQTLGWADLGYNVLIDRFGQIYEGRAGGLHRHINGAHALGFNSGTFGIAVMGNHQSVQASAEARESVMAIAAWKLLATFRTDVSETASWTVGVDGARWPRGSVRSLPRFFGHRDVNFTDCPGTSLYGQMASLRWGIQSRIDSGWRNHLNAFRSAGGESRLGTVTHTARSEGAHTVTRLTRGLVVSGSGLNARAGATEPAILSSWDTAWGRPLGNSRADADRIIQPFDHGVAVLESGSTRFSARAFRDVAPTRQFFVEIHDLRTRGIATGWPDNTYRPDANQQRDAMIVFLYRAMGSPSFTPPGSSPFRDIRSSTMFYREMTWAHAQGITNGWPDGTFRPTAPVERGAVAAFLHRAAGSPPPAGDAPTFRDVPARHQFATEIAWMAGAGITRGWPDGTFRPRAHITRDAMAAFVLRWMDATGR
ncbi:MAG: S-layer homology domain-containing protein [Brachybacterium sp.]|nr:S-layer homology domain-containing protein [Brachybacterium sp.]